MAYGNDSIRNITMIRSDQDLIPFGNHSNHQYVGQDHVILKVNHVILKVDHVSKIDQALHEVTV